MVGSNPVSQTLSPHNNQTGLEALEAPAAKIANTSSCSSSFDSAPFDTSFDPVAFFGDANVLPDAITAEAALGDDDVDASNLTSSANCFDSILDHEDSLGEPDDVVGRSINEDNDCNNHAVANQNTTNGVSGVRNDRPNSAVDSSTTFSAVEDESNENAASPPNISSNVDFELDQLLDQNSHSDFNVSSFSFLHIFSSNF